MKNDLKIPNVFRILVIDDQLCSDVVCIEKTSKPAKIVQERCVTRYFKQILSDLNVKCAVDVVYAKDPDEGVALWIDQIFDLTLVDSDFSKGDSSPQKDSEKRNFLDLKLEFMGAYLFRFLHAMANSKENQLGREGCEIALWTGLGLSDKAKKERAVDLLNILNATSSNEIVFIPKKESIIGEEACDTKAGCGWKGIVDNRRIKVRTISECIAGMCAKNPVLNSGVNIGAMGIIERIKKLYPISTPAEFKEWCGLDGYVYTGCLYESKGMVCLSDAWKDNGVLLSPILRRHGAQSPNQSDAKDLCSPPVDRKMRTPEEITNNLNGREHVVAAATPLTGCSAAGVDCAIEMLQAKIKALLDGPFEKVVLKTVYLDFPCQWSFVKWPSIQAQSNHRTRCLRSTKYPRTLWNTGKTAMEAFPPEMMNIFLKNLTPTTYQERIIVSLGSKYPQAALEDGRLLNFEANLEFLWNMLFERVFRDIEPSAYPIVEINVRHYLRECVADQIGGNEYLSPNKIDAKFTGNYTGVDDEFKKWLEIIDVVAGKYGKRLLLKLPFRGDLLHFIRLIEDCILNLTVKNIAGITLINAFKSAEGETEGGLNFSPGWYGMPDAWNDGIEKKWKYQMSGELLAASRNELMGEIVSFARRNANLQIHISGGIVDKEGIEFCRKKAPNIYVQIGTWALLDLNLSKQELLKCSSIPPSSGNVKPHVKNTCRGSCSPCRVKCRNGAFIFRPGRPSHIDDRKCINCKECISQCICSNIENSCKMTAQSDEDAITKKDLLPRIAFCIHQLCNGCGRCSRTFYCDTFLDRRGKDLPPIMDLQNCTGCGLCVQTCPNGAIQLFAPKDVVVIAGGLEDNAMNLKAWHKYLINEEIPHIVIPQPFNKNLFIGTILEKSPKIDCGLQNPGCPDKFSKLSLKRIRTEVENRINSQRQKCDETE
ncbi:MAG: 4Fe-4S binding protein [Kiritimatiellae bacterium]|nr:4Fe-4S binding protein [Kiritimatiellia bacterium]